MLNNSECVCLHSLLLSIDYGTNNDVNYIDTEKSNKWVKEIQVLLPNTLSSPRTVMIQLMDTNIAVIAMGSSLGAMYFAHATLNIVVFVLRFHWFARLLFIIIVSLFLSLPPWIFSIDNTRITAGSHGIAEYQTCIQHDSGHTNWPMDFECRKIKKYKWYPNDQKVCQKHARPIWPNQTCKRKEWLLSATEPISLANAFRWATMKCVYISCKHIICMRCNHYTSQSIFWVLESEDWKKTIIDEVKQ